MDTDSLRIAICEDEEGERQDLLHMIQQTQYTTELTFFSSGEEFLAKFQCNQYDLILMDIFMGGETGIQVITKMRMLDSEVPVVFITTSEDFALESYRLNAIKYIEKPATAQGLTSALQLAKLKQQANSRRVLHINSSTPPYPLSRILYLEQKARALTIYLLDDETVIVNKKLDDIELQLVANGFLRCHKSFLVNLSHICGIDRELSTFEMKDGSKVYIRRRSFWEMQKAFEAYLFTTRQEELYE